MKDMMTRKASYDQVAWALHELFCEFRKGLDARGIEFLDYLIKAEHEALRQAHKKAREDLCVMLGWTLDLHEAIFDAQVLADMQAEQ